MPNLVKRSLQILVGGVTETGKDYMSNIDTLVNDSKAVWSSIKNSSTSSTDTFRQMKAGNIFKNISNWFYQNENDYDDYDLNDNQDDFDPGYEIDDDESTAEVNNLDADAMKDIVRGQVGAMYKIAGKQNEAQIASTAEVVATFNKRSSEILTSVNNINSTLLSISTKLDSLISSNKQETSRSNNKSKLYDYEGKLSISSIFDAAKDKIVNNDIISMGGMAASMIGQLTPENVVSMILKETVGNKEFKFLGDRSINQIGERLNDAVDVITQEVLSGLIDSKPFKKIFGDLNEGVANKDYSKIAAKNKYNTESAVFDNMTRHTIISVIPEYLKQINQSLSGERLEIDHEGKLTTKPKNVFNTSTRESFGSSGLSWDFRDSIHDDVKAANVNISKTDVNEAGRVLTMVYVMHLYRVGRKALRTNQLSTSDTSVILQAVKTLASASGKPESYWEPICMTIMQKLSTDIREANNFVANVNKQLARMDKVATENARNPVIANQATKLTYEIAESEYFEHYKKDIKDEEERLNNERNNQEKNLFKRLKNNYNQNGSLFGGNKDKKKSEETNASQPPVGTKNAPSTQLGLIDYARGIFGILNRGINVKVTNKRNNTRGYGKYDINGNNPTVTPVPVATPPNSSNNKNNGSASPTSNNTTTATPPPTQSNNPNDGNNVKVSDGENKNTLEDAVNQLIPKTFRIPMQMFGEKLKNVTNQVKNTVTGNNTTPDGENPTTQTENASAKINNAIAPVANKVKDVTEKIIGKKVEDDNGEHHREGGVVQKAGNKANEIKTNAVSKVKDTIDNIVIKDNYNKAMKTADSLDTTDEDAKQDQLKAHNIFALMQTAVEDGETSADIGAITQQINSIKDDKLKQQLQNSVIPMLQRSGAKSEKKSSGLMRMLFKGLKKLFLPALMVIKTISKVLLRIGSKILAPVKKGIMAGVSNIKSGVKNVAQGLFGTKGESKGLIRNAVIDPAKNLASKAVTSVKDKLSNSDSDGKVSQLIKKSTDKINNFLTKDKSNEGDENGEKTQKGISGFISRLNPKTDFGKGFVSAFQKDAVAAEKKRIESLTVETVADAETREMKEFMTGNKESLFSKTFDFIKQIKEKLVGPDEEEIVDGENSEDQKSDDEPKENDEAKNNETSEEETTATIPSTETTPTTEDTQGEETTTATTPDTNVTEPTTGGGTSDEDTTKATLPPTENGGTTDNKTGGTGNAGSGSSDGGGVTGASAASGKGGKLGALFDLGKIAGGMSQLVMGVGQIIATVVAATKVFEVVQKLMSMIFEDALKPLSKIGDALFKTLKPIVSKISEIISQVAECLGTLLETVMDVISPVLEALMPLLNVVLDVLSPILDVLNVVLNIVLAPLMSVIENVISPILMIIGDTVQIILGILQVGIGSIITSIGAVVSGIGAIARIFGVKSLAEQGKKLMDQGTDMVKGGIDSVVTGTKNLVIDRLNMIPGVEIERTDSNDSIFADKPEKEPEEIHGSIMDGVVGSGNISNTDSHNITNNIYNTYGSGPQSSYGSFMNMSQRGCGPIALADAYSRRAGSAISPRSMASYMANTGTYSPNSGTSVGGFVDAGRSLGMNMRVGGVTQASLKQASPRNPITVIGSGSDFGTRRGNNHYVNVVGTDGTGGAYVSNPITGRIDRKPISTVAGNSLMGIYGSGDEDDGLFHFDEGVTSAMKELSDWTGSLLKMFEFNSTEDQAKETMDKKKKEANLLNIQKTLGSDKFAEYEDKAFDLFKNENPKKDGESDDDYKKRFEKKKDDYLLKVTSEDARKKAEESGDSVTNAVNKTSEGLFGSYDPETGEFSGGGFVDTLDETIAKIEANSKFADNSSGGGSGSSGYFTADNGAALWVPYSDNIEVTETDITKNNYSSPLFEFFAKTMGENLGYVYGSSWFKQRNNPNKEGVGSSGDNHSGIDFANVDSKQGKPLYATTAGVVHKVMLDGQGDGGCGNSIIWKDSGGMYHWYMHMMSAPEIQSGTVNAGDLLGYIGSTGNSTGTHLHYTITSDPSSSGAAPINPLMYFKNYNPTGGNIQGSNNEEKVYNYLTNSLGVSGIGAAGMMGCFKYESNMQTDNLENQYQATFGYPSGAAGDAEYTRDVNSGKESRDDFIYGRGRPEKVGYGIAQFTSSNLKEDLYKRTVDQGKSIDDMATQLDAIVNVLKERNVYDLINNASDPTEANKYFLWRYEAGTGYQSDEAVLNAYPWMNTNTDGFPNGVAARHGAAENYYKLFKDATFSNLVNGEVIDKSNPYNNVDNDMSVFNPSSADAGLWATGHPAIVNTQTDPLCLRSEPNQTSTIIAWMPKGTKITASEPRELYNSGWYKVIYDDLTGYASSNYIKGITQGQYNRPTLATKPWEYEGENENDKNRRGYTSGDPRYYKKAGNEYGFDERIYTNNDPRWRAAWYNSESPRHYNEIYSSGENLAHMMSLATSPNKREGKFYNQLVQQNPTTDTNYFIQGLKDTRLSAQEWQNAATAYRQAGDRITSKITDKKSGLKKGETVPLVEDLMFLHNAYYPNSKLSLNQINTRIKGSGDVDDGYDTGYYNDLVSQAIYGSEPMFDQYQPTMVVPPIDESKFAAMDQGYYFEDQQPTIVNNNYYATKDNDRESDIRRLLSNTYNIRAERIEALMETMIDILKERKEEKTKGGSIENNSPQELFSDGEIPPQLVRLYTGT